MSFGNRPDLTSSGGLQSKAWISYVLVSGGKGVGVDLVLVLGNS